MNRVEQRYHNKQIKAFVSADEVMIVLLRPSARTETAAGGRKEGPLVPLPAQKFRLTPFKRRLTHSTVSSEEGDVVNNSYILTTDDVNADIQKRDRFVLNGGNYEVMAVQPERTIKTQADVTYHGGGDPWQTT